MFNRYHLFSETFSLHSLSQFLNVNLFGGGKISFLTLRFFHLAFFSKQVAKVSMGLRERISYKKNVVDFLNNLCALLFCATLNRLRINESRNTTLIYLFPSGQCVIHKCLKHLK